MNKSLKEQAHGEIERIFRILLPQNGLAVREEQITLCHAMLDTLLKNNIALCDAGVGIGKTYAYLTACILLKKFAHMGLPVPAGWWSPPPALLCRTLSSGNTSRFYPGFFWRTALFKNPSGRWCEKGKNALSAMPVLQGGWKPFGKRKRMRSR